jgi:hypothetical protein
MLTDLRGGIGKVERGNFCPPGVGLNQLVLTPAGYLDSHRRQHESWTC